MNINKPVVNKIANKDKRSFKNFMNRLYKRFIDTTVPIDKIKTTRRK